MNLNIALNRKAPDRVRLWRLGENATDYGVHFWTDRSIEACLTRYLERGNKLAVDIEHNLAHAEEGEVVPTAGYCEFEVVGGEPWLTFEWSQRGRDEIETGQRRYLSPEYEVSEDGEIVSLLRVSLVAEPATFNALVLASKRRTNMAKRIKANTVDASGLLDGVATVLDDESIPAEERVSQAKAVIEGLKAAVDGATDDSTEGTDESTTAAGEGTTTEEVTASADDGDEKDKEKVEASADDGDEKDKVEATAKKIAASVARRVDKDRLELLLAEHGHELAPEVRAVAASMPYDTVKRIVTASIAKRKNAELRERPARGARDEQQGAERDIVEASRERIRAAKPSSPLARFAAMAGVKSAPKPVHFDAERGAYVFPTRKPSEIRAALAARK